MRARLLPPEAHIDLQISLDRLRSSAEECRAALVGLVEGHLNPEDYRSVVQRQFEAQRHWEDQQRKYFGALEPAEPVG